MTFTVVLYFNYTFPRIAVGDQIDVVFVIKFFEIYMAKAIQCPPLGRSGKFCAVSNTSENVIYIYRNQGS